MNTSKDYTISAVQKALTILRLFGDNDELTLMQISGLSGIGKSSALRLLYTLHNEGFVAFNEKSKRYSLGLTVFELGIKKYESMNFRKIAVPHLKRMADETGLICYLGIHSENKVAMVEKIFPKTTPMWAQLMAQAGGTIPMYSTGIGRLFLARMSDEQVIKYLDAAEIRSITPDTITDKKQLLEMVRLARREGVSINKCENEPYIASICAPICDNTGAMVAGMSICGMKEMVCGPEYERLKRMILDAAAAISEELGHHP